jgi:hypothetical protein
MHILSKHRELSKQINIHEIVETFRRNLATKGRGKKKKKKKKKKKDNLVQACKVRANLTSGREV